MPEPYKVIYDWKFDDRQHKIVGVSCHEENIPLEMLGDIVAAHKDEVPKACLTVNQFNTIQLTKGGFLYMDVGC